MALGITYVAHLGTLLHQRAKYTIGYLTGSFYQPKASGKRFNYRFEVQGTIYEGIGLHQTGMDDRVGARFVVEYDSTSPVENNGYLGLRIPDSIRHAPVTGWSRPPFPIPQWILDRNKPAE